MEANQSVEPPPKTFHSETQTESMGYKISGLYRSFHPSFSKNFFASAIVRSFSA